MQAVREAVDRSRSPKKLQRLQQWQAEHAAATTPFSEQIQKLEKSITAALNEQTQKQRFHREELVKEFVSPIKKSIQENHVQLMTSCEEQQRQNLSLEEVVGSVKNVAASVMDLRQQVLNSKHKAFCEENVKAITAEADTVRAALTLLQDRIDSLDGTMKLCSNQVSSVLQGVEIKHNALMAAVTASSCNCPSELALAEHLLDAGRESRKRKRSMSRRDAVEPSQASYSDSSLANESPPPTRSRYQPRHQVDTKNWEPNQGGSIGGLHHALHRIEALSANRRHYRHYQQNF
ncbi:unnamed protein product [Phytophthora lilii]|uniref:Unnamed protein product n=1 Tax=Phytophthora lilii TaxID=2077276 RepID=A0A9W6TBN0_9STRA|nr:unnamed protein product [Phytophthora lilii]